MGLDATPWDPIVGFFVGYFRSLQGSNQKVGTTLTPLGRPSQKVESEGFGQPTGHLLFGPVMFETSDSGQIPRTTTPTMCSSFFSPRLPHRLKLTVTTGLGNPPVAQQSVTP
jgi:hypothetical protein